jgi:hypothetical protein
MGKENGEGTVQWFTTKLGLCNEGIDIHKKLDDIHATFAKCEVMWGKIKCHDRFKYETCTNLKIIVRILELYLLIYQKQEITNNNIALSFAKALFVERKKIKVN